MKWRASLVLVALLTSPSAPLLAQAPVPPKDPAGAPAAPFETLEAQKARFRKMLSDEDIDVRVPAALWLSKMGDASGNPQLLEFAKSLAAKQEWYSAMEREVLLALGRNRCREAVPWLIREVADHQPYEVLGILGAIGDRSAIPALKKVADQHSQANFRLLAAASLVELGDQTYRGLFLSTFKGNDAEAKIQAVVIGASRGILQTFPLSDVLPLLLEDNRTRYYVEQALSAIGPGIVPQLLPYLDDRDPALAASVAVVLADLGYVSVRSRCLDWMHSGDLRLTTLALTALGKIRDPRDGALLVQALFDPRSQGSGESGKPYYCPSWVADETLMKWDASIVPALCEALRQPWRQGTDRVAQLLQMHRGHGATELLLRRIEDCPNDNVRGALFGAIGSDSRENLALHRKELLDLFAHGDPSMRSDVAIVLGKTGCPEARDVLIRTLETHQNQSLTYCCIQALGDIGDPAAIEVIRKIAGYETLEEEVLHKLAPDRYPEPIAALLRRAHDGRNAGDYERMMAEYVRVAEFLEQRLQLEVGHREPQDCAWRVLRDSEGERDFEIEIELVKCGEETTVVAYPGGDRDMPGVAVRKGALRPADFSRLWRVASAFIAGIDKGGIPEIPWGESIGHGGFGMVIDCWQGENGSGSTVTCPYHSSAGYDPPLSREGLIQELRELMLGQWRKANKPLPPSISKVLRARARAMARAHGRAELHTVAEDAPWRLGPKTRTVSTVLVPISDPRSTQAQATLHTDDPDPRVRFDAALGLAEPGWQEAIAHAQILTADPDPFVREAAEEARVHLLLRKTPPEQLPGLLATEFARGQWIVLETLSAEILFRRDLRLVDSLLVSDEPRLRIWGLNLAREMGAQELAGVLQRIAESDPWKGDPDGSSSRWWTEGEFPIRKKAARILKLLAGRKPN